MRALIDDLAFAFRTLRTDARFAAAVTLVLALGIGANSAIFSLVDAALFRGLSVQRPDELVRVFSTQPHTRDLAETSYPGYLDYRDNVPSFSGLAAFGTDIALHITSDARLPERVSGTVVSGNFFTVLGARPAAGRLITPADDARGAAAVAVLADEFWRRRFDADPGVIGTTVRINGFPFILQAVRGDYKHVRIDAYSSRCLRIRVCMRSWLDHSRRGCQPCWAVNLARRRRWSDRFSARC